MQTPMITSSPPSAAIRAASSLTMPFLEPEDASPDRDRLPGHLRRVLRTPEHVHNVDVEIAWDVEEGVVGLLPQDLRLVRVHRHDPIPVLLQV